jgi:hypothetical protein
MKKISSDLSRFVNLEGVGEVSRPVDIDQSVTGFSDLVSLRIYKFLSGQVINGEAEDDEVCIVFLSGDVMMEVTGKGHYSWAIHGRKNVFDAPPHVVYLPPHYHYKLSPHTDAEVAYARAKAKGHFPPRLIEPKILGRSDEDHLVQLLREGEAEKLLCSEFRLARGGEQTFEESPCEHLVHIRFEPSSSNAVASPSEATETLPLTHGDSLAIEAGERVVVRVIDGDLYGLHVSVEKPST